MSTVLQSPLQLPLHGSALIEASAGTGKTYTIAALYVRFVLAHIPHQQISDTQGVTNYRVGRPPLLPPNILVVTFTKAATAELKDRIRQRLVQSAAWFRDTTANSSGDPVLDQLRESYSPDYWPACAQALQAASEWMDEASVKTIHSWCQTLLREHAFSSGSLFSQELTTELSQFKLDAVRDYWREWVYPLGRDDYLAVAAVAQSPAALLSQLRTLWQQVGEGQPEPLDIASLRQQKVAQYQAQLGQAHRDWQSWLPSLYAYVDEADANNLISNKRKLSKAKVRSGLKSIQQWVDLDPASAIEKGPPKVTASQINNYSRAGFAELISQPLPELPFLDQTGALAALADNAPSIRNELLQHATQWVKHRFSERLKQRALMGFDDIIQQCRQAMERDQGEHLAALVRAQFPVAMVDEFQDTDPDQYAIFKAVYQIGQDSVHSAPETEPACYLIGDPKQAIYAFRGADIFTYLQARRDTEGHHYTLARNFRSTVAMVEASNGIFMSAEAQQPKKAFMFNSKQGNEVPFVAVEANGQNSELILQGQPATKALTLWTTLNPDDEAAKLSKEAYMATQAESFASYIVSLLNDAEQGTTGIRYHGENGHFRALRSADMAVLVNSRNQGYQIQQSLRQRGVASVFLSDRNSVYATPVAFDLLQILQACANPGQRQSLSNALFTALLALPVQELEQLQHDDAAWDLQVEKFYQLQQTWQARGVLALVHQLTHDFGIATRLLAQLGGERDATDLLHLAELLQQAASRLDGEQALLRFLQEKIYQTDDDTADEQIVRLESDAQLVQIVTVHKSKGLEYPLVFLPFSSDSKASKKTPKVVFYHDQDGQRRVSLEPTEEQIARADEERLGEEIRHLYVALTRSKYACWASLAPVSEWQKSALGYLAGAAAESTGDAQNLLRAAEQAWGEQEAIDMSPQPLGDSQNWVPRAQSMAPPTYCKMPDSHQFEAWWVASYSALKYGSLREPETPHEANLLEETAEPLEPAESTSSVPDSKGQIHDLPRGAGPGTFLHNILEDAAELGFAKVAEDSKLRAQLLQKRCKYGHWASRVEQLDGWLQSYLQSPLLQRSLPLPQSGPNSAAGQGHEPENCWALADLHHYKAEPEFWFAVQGVSTERLDTLISRYVMPQYARPRLQTNYLNGMLKGFIDLVFEHQGRYYVVDYKSNYLGSDNEAYSHEALRNKVLASRYDLQYVLYTLALHKLLKARLGPSYDYQKHVGGVFYLFLRGHESASRGVFQDKPNVTLIEQLDRYFVDRSADTGSSAEVAND